MFPEGRKQSTSPGLQRREEAFGPPVLKLPLLAGAMAPHEASFSSLMAQFFFVDFCFSLPRLLSGSLISSRLPTCLLCWWSQTYSAPWALDSPAHFSTALLISGFFVWPVGSSSVLCLDLDLGQVLPIPPSCPSLYLSSTHRETYVQPSQFVAQEPSQRHSTVRTLSYLHM